LVNKLEVDMPCTYPLLICQYSIANKKGVTDTPTTHVNRALNKALDDLLKDGIIDKIIQDAFAK
jgi:ABC-type amino acid transport substrate-binding protein